MSEDTRLSPEDEKAIREVIALQWRPFHEEGKKLLAEIDALREQNAKLRCGPNGEEYIDPQRRIAELEKQNATLDLKCAQLEKQLTELMPDYEGIHRIAAERIADLEAQDAALLAENEMIKQGNQQLAQRKCELEAELQAADLNVRSLTEQRDFLHACNEGCKLTLAGAIANLQSAKARVKELAPLHAAYKLEVKKSLDSEREIARLTAWVGELESQITSYTRNGTGTVLMRQQDLLQARVTDQDREIAKLTARVRELEEHLENPLRCLNQEHEIVRLRSELEEARSGANDDR